MKTYLEVWKNEGKDFSDIRVAWDWIKYNASFSIEYAKERTKIKREKEENLQKLQAAQTRFQQNPCEEFEEILNKCKLD